jgi:hypothetical protein
MNNFPTYIGALVASWTAMNRNPKTKFEPSRKSSLALICLMCFWLGYLIGGLILLLIF